MSLVWKSTSSSPGTGATSTRLPAAITIWSAVICSPEPFPSVDTVRVWSSTKVAWEEYTSTLGSPSR